jgi:hypothetical protein
MNNSEMRYLSCCVGLGGDGDKILETVEDKLSKRTLICP